MKKDYSVFTHRHCLICGISIPPDKNFCSEKCEKEYEKSMKRRRTMNIFLVLMFIIYFIIFLVIIPMFSRPTSK
ncbi:MAG: DUF2116 family Zn-ribbon domain-containing protein [Nitrososphaerota archaeon]